MMERRPPWISGPRVATRAWTSRVSAARSSSSGSVDRTLHDHLAEVHGGAPAGGGRRRRHLVQGRVAGGHVLFALEEDERVGGAARAVANDDDPLGRDPWRGALPPPVPRLVGSEAL